MHPAVLVDLDLADRHESADALLPWAAQFSLHQPVDPLSDRLSSSSCSAARICFTLVVRSPNNVSIPGDAAGLIRQSCSQPEQGSIEMKGTLLVSIDHRPQQSAWGSDFAGGVSCGDGRECGQGLDAAEHAAGLSPGIVRDAEFCTDVKTSLQQIVPCGEAVLQ